MKGYINPVHPENKEHINSVHSENKSEIEAFVHRLIALRDEWRKFIEKSYPYNDNSLDIVTKNSDNIIEKWNIIAKEFVSYEPKNDADLKAKVRCLCLLNAIDSRNINERISDTDNVSTQLAWSVIRDFANVRLGIPNGDFAAMGT